MKCTNARAGPVDGRAYKHFEAKRRVSDLCMYSGARGPSCSRPDAALHEAPGVWDLCRGTSRGSVLPNAPPPPLQLVCQGKGSVPCGCRRAAADGGPGKDLEGSTPCGCQVQVRLDSARPTALAFPRLSRGRTGPCIAVGLLPLAFLAVKFVRSDLEFLRPDGPMARSARRARALELLLAACIGPSLTRSVLINFIHKFSPSPCPRCPPLTHTPAFEGKFIYIPHVHHPSRSLGAACCRHSSWSARRGRAPQSAASHAASTIARRPHSTPRATSVCAHGRLAEPRNAESTSEESSAGEPCAASRRKGRGKRVGRGAAALLAGGIPHASGLYHRAECRAAPRAAASRASPAQR